MPKGKPNILVIWGDDVGITNLSCYSDGLMGYRTPNIDRIAAEELHRRSGGLHHRSEPLSHGPDQGRCARCGYRAAG